MLEETEESLSSVVQPLLSPWALVNSSNSQSFYHKTKTRQKVTKLGGGLLGQDDQRERDGDEKVGAVIRMPYYIHV